MAGAADTWKANAWFALEKQGLETAFRSQIGSLFFQLVQELRTNKPDHSKAIDDFGKGLGAVRLALTTALDVAENGG